jgi:hypothetical protein
MYAPLYGPTASLDAYSDSSGSFILKRQESANTRKFKSSLSASKTIDLNFYFYFHILDKPSYLICDGNEIKYLPRWSFWEGPSPWWTETRYCKVLRFLFAFSWNCMTSVTWNKKMENKNEQSKLLETTGGVRLQK